jgi:hypothetical protein
MSRGPFVVSLSNHERTYDTISGGEGKGEGVLRDFFVTGGLYATEGSSGSCNRRGRRVG